MYHLFLSFLFFAMGLACRILVPQPRIPPAPLAVKVRPNPWTTREFPVGTFSDALYHLTPGGITLYGIGTSLPLTPQTVAIHSSPAPGSARSNQVCISSSSPSVLIYKVTVTIFFSRRVTTSMLKDKTETSKWEQFKLPSMTSLSPRHIPTSVDIWKHTSDPHGYSTSFPQLSCQKGESMPLAST